MATLAGQCAQTLCCSRAAVSVTVRTGLFAPAARGPFDAHHTVERAGPVLCCCRPMSLVVLRASWRPSRRMSSHWTPSGRTYTQVQHSQPAQQQQQVECAATVGSMICIHFAGQRCPGGRGRAGLPVALLTPSDRPLYCRSLVAGVHQLPVCAQAWHISLPGPVVFRGGGRPRRVNQDSCTEVSNPRICCCALGFVPNDSLGGRCGFV
jgi:hypothetical protein